MTRAHNERCPECKKTIEKLLSSLFGEVRAGFDLDLPSTLSGYEGTGVYDALERIHSSLQRHRGFGEFVKRKKLAAVDYFIPKTGLILEFDESQHFTKPREIALSHYPKGHTVGFSVERWSALCLKLNKKDDTPPYRDEQRAWYDTLRDFAPLALGKGRIQRLYAKDQVWCALNAKNKDDLKKFQRLISST